MRQPDVEHVLRPYVPDLLLDWSPEVAWLARDGTLVSADISGFTALSERLAAKGKEGAEELSALICDCFEGMVEDAAQRGGDVVKFGGDAVLVWFEGTGHARRATSAAIAMRQTIRRDRRTSDGRKVPLSISIGLNSGVHHFFQIVAGVPDLIVTGPGATATVRAESDAGAGMILVTPPTAALLPPEWLGEPHGCGVVVKRRRADEPDWSGDRRQWVRPPSAFVPEVHQAAVLAGIVNEHRQVAVSFLTFGGADRLVAEGELALLAERLQLVSNSIAEVCERDGTHLLATDIAPDGGKFVIAAGAPRALGNNEDRLLRTIRSVVDADPGLELHAGINRGSLFAGDLGSTRRRVFTTLGDSMNLAARLSARAAPGEIVVSRVAMEWSSDEFEVEPITPFHVKGKAQAIHAVLLGPYRGRRAEQFQFETPLVGRANELQRLRELTDAVADGASRGAVVLGEHGVGKTRLLAELTATQPADRRVVLVRCAVLDRSHGRSGIADVVRSLLGLDLDTPATEVLERLRVLGAEQYPESVALLPLLGPILDVELADTPESALVPRELRAVRTAQLLVQIVTALTPNHTVLIVDDLQYADETTAATIDLLCVAGLGAPLCTIAVTTGEHRPDAPLIELGPMPIDEVSTLVDTLVGEAELASHTVRDIAERSGGNPMFASELVNAVLEGAEGIPDTLDAAVEARLDRLEPADRLVLSTASVLGTEVQLPMLAKLIDRQILSDNDRWGRLGEFLERVGPGVVRFRFDTHRRVAYEKLPFRTRRAHHRAVLAMLEAEPGEPGRERLAMMAHHASVSGDPVATWRHATPAAENTAALGLFREAAELYRLAWFARKAASATELATVSERAGDALEVVGDFAAAAEAYARASSLVDGPVARARLMRKRGDISERQGDYTAAHAWYRRAARQLDGTNWTAAISEQAQLDCARSGLALRQAQFGEAWRFGNLALSQAERIGDWTTAAHAALMVDNLVTQLSWSGVHVARPDVLALHERAGDLLGAARWLSNQAVDRYYEGAWDEAVAMYRESASQCARFGHLVSEATAINNIAEIESDRGRYEEARNLLRGARRSWRAIGFGVGIALAQSNLGRLATRTASYDEAVPLLTEAIERFDALGMPAMAGDARLRLIENGLLSGDGIDDAWWPTDDDLEDDVVTQIYGERMRAVAAYVAERWAEADRRSASAVERARAAAVPFDLVLALRVRQMIAGDVDPAEIDAIHAQLGIVEAPRVIPEAAAPGRRSA